MHVVEVFVEHVEVEKTLSGVFYGAENHLQAAIEDVINNLVSIKNSDDLKKKGHQKENILPSAYWRK